MQDQQIRVTGAGNADTNKNTIVPPIFAEMFRFLIGVDVCFLSRGFFDGDPNTQSYDKITAKDYNWDIVTDTSYSITINKGMASIYGYLAYSDEPYTFSVEPPSSGTKYAWIYVKLDLSQEEAECTLGIEDRGGNSDMWEDADDDNLTLVPNGRYILPIYRLNISTSGAVTVYKNKTALNLERGKNIPNQNYGESARFANVSDTSKVLNDQNPSSSTNVAYMITTKKVSIDY